MNVELGVVNTLIWDGANDKLEVIQILEMCFWKLLSWAIAFLRNEREKKSVDMSGFAILPLAA